MITIKLNTNFPEWPLVRQTPGRRGVWGDCRFVINDAADECDFWVVYEGLLQEETVSCNPRNTIFITGEPTDIRSYSQAFLDQFARVVTSQECIRHPGVVRQQQGLPWMFGVSQPVTPENAGQALSYEELKQPNPKTALLSVICSNKAITQGHRQRLKLVHALQEYFGNDIQVFGRGFREVADKREAIAPYRYHVALENSSHDDYWTEKLADAYLGEAFPFYSGCSNVDAYFPADSLARIDIAKPDEAVRIIRRGIDDNLADRGQESLREARRRVLDEYNLFAALANLCHKLDSGPKQRLRLLPEAAFDQGLFARGKRWAGRIKARMMG